MFHSDFYGLNQNKIVGHPVNPNNVWSTNDGFFFPPDYVYTCRKNYLLVHDLLNIENEVDQPVLWSLDRQMEVATEHK